MPPSNDVAAAPRLARSKVRRSTPSGPSVHSRLRLVRQRRPTLGPRSSLSLLLGVQIID